MKREEVLLLETNKIKEVDDFSGFYNLFRDGKRKIGTQITKGFYFYTGDDISFDDSIPFENKEILYRNSLRELIKDYFGFTDKINQWEMLSKAIYGGDPKDYTECFYWKKRERYVVFMDALANFALSLIHNLYWRDFKSLTLGTTPLRSCIKSVMDIVDDVHNKFISKLDEEYNTKDIEDELGIGTTSKKLAVTSNVEEPKLEVGPDLKVKDPNDKPKKKRSSKKKKDDEKKDDEKKDETSKT